MQFFFNTDADPYTSGNNGKRGAVIHVHEVHSWLEGVVKDLTAHQKTQITGMINHSYHMGIILGMNNAIQGFDMGTLLKTLQQQEDPKNKPKRYNIDLLKVGEHKISVIKIVRKFMHSDLRAAKLLVESAPTLLGVSLTESRAYDFRNELIIAGALADIEPETTGEDDE